MPVRKPTEESGFNRFIDTWRQETLSRRRFLLRMAGGSLALLMPLSQSAQDENGDPDRQWRVLGAVQNRLFPSEANAPGAEELNALDYLKWVVADRKLDAEDRRFILRGVDWLEDLTREVHAQSFSDLSIEQQDAILRRIARSDAGENWLATLLLYLFEALLSDPVYGGNPHEVGWHWLGHRPGFPRPTAHNRYKAG
ncbi:MAG: gluconate 2-dehydrogenase subunit 3 family protein [Gammaproteobacteria bacterium]|nr:gluconate 2-dehydrogenase subunit 3 family protein [Gammaproteobacteria bacterium]